ncbi:MAG: hypothetical protein CMJ23_03960 [Phycisphaerae bacterium]|nr:hypothetical protein [Phycisphaerae bacterium]
MTWDLGVILGEVLFAVVRGSSRLPGGPRNGCLADRVGKSGRWRGRALSIQGIRFTERFGGRDDAPRRGSWVMRRPSAWKHRLLEAGSLEGLIRGSIA